MLRGAVCIHVCDISLSGHIVGANLPCCCFGKRDDSLILSWGKRVAQIHQKRRALEVNQ